MNNRIKELRKHLGLTLEEFGRRLGVTRAAISNIENGNRNVTGQMIVSICREFDVNEEWFRHGYGEMIRQRSRSEIIVDFSADLLKQEDDSFKRKLIEALAVLDESEWEVLEKLALKLAKKD